MNKPKILVVDDSTMTRKFYTYMLTSVGYQVQEAEDGYIAMELLYSDSFDLIITDINMPRMDGFKFIKEVRKLPAYQKKPLIIVTTQNHKPDLEQGIMLGADIYLVKPTESEKLISQVKCLLRGAGGKEAE